MICNDNKKYPGGAIAASQIYSFQFGVGINFCLLNVSEKMVALTFASDSTHLTLNLFQWNTLRKVSDTSTVKSDVSSSTKCIVKVCFGKFFNIRAFFKLRL